MTMSNDDTSGVGRNVNRTPQHSDQPYYHSATNGNNKKGNGNDDNNDDDDDDDDEISRIISGGRSQNRRTPWSMFRSIEPESVQSSSILFSSGLPSFAKICIRSVAVATITLYVLNQKHMLPRPMGMWVSKLLFWPTLPITVSRRIGKWTTVVDNAVVLGGAPFGFLGYPEKLAKKYNVRGVLNMCDEYRGPVKSYQRLGIEHLRLPTVDHFEPSVEDLKRAVSFIQKHESQGGKVYVHCRAGHGRSAAAVYAWLLYKEPLADPVDLNEKLCAMRDVRKYLWKQPNVNTFRLWLQNGGRMDDSDTDDDNNYSRSKHQGANRHRHGPSDNIIQPSSAYNTKSRDAMSKRRREYESFTESESEDVSDDCSDDERSIHNTNAFSTRKESKGSSHSSLGQVFSDEELSTDDYSDYDFNDNGVYDDGFSEDERDYKMWKSYQQD